MEKAFDIIIAGGGAAGLSLAYRLVSSPLRDRSILIVDKDKKEHNDRTWCFWTAEPTPFDGIVYREWDQLRVMSEGDSRTLNLGEYRYKMIRGADFYRFMRQELASYPNVTFLHGKIDQIEDGAEAAQVMVDGQVFTGSWVFSSLFNIRQIHPDPARYRCLEQHFLGWEIETAQDAFDPQAAIFFDFRTPQKEALRFFYVLPFTERRALVEGVFQKQDGLGRRDPSSPALRDYIENTLGITDYRIVAKEGGVTPLTDQPFPRRLGRRIMSVGILGGQIKPTSGYAFTRIQRDSAAIVQSLLHKGHPFDVPGSPWIYRWCDTLLLQIMLQHSQAVVPTFVKMFQRNPVGRIFRFLDEVSSPWENFLLMASLAQPVMVPVFIETRRARTRPKTPALAKQTS